MGRVAGRLKGGRFTLNGRDYPLENNDGISHVHGLFAGGMDAGGLMGDAYDVSVAPTSTQGWCVYCGRTAAQFAAENLI